MRRRNLRFLYTSFPESINSQHFQIALQRDLFQLLRKPWAEEKQMLTAGIQLKSSEVERPKGLEQSTDSNSLMS